MKIKILGCGNAFSTKNGNNCILLEENNRKMLIDAGWALPYMLETNSVELKDINDIYISHLHSDHIGGLEYIAFRRYDWIHKPELSDGKDYDYNAYGEISIKKPTGYAPNLIANESLMRDMWEKTLRGGLESIEGQQTTLETFFNTYCIKPNTAFYWEGWKCNLVQQIHVMNGYTVVPTFGIFMEKQGHESVYFVTDSQHYIPAQIKVFYDKADKIFQDCEITPFQSNVHSNYVELVKHEAPIKRKMYLTHFQDFKNDKKDFFGNECDWDAKAEQDGFAGFVYVGQEFEV